MCSCRGIARDGGKAGSPVAVMRHRLLLWTKRIGATGKHTCVEFINVFFFTSVASATETLPVAEQETSATGKHTRSEFINVSIPSIASPSESLSLLVPSCRIRRTNEKSASAQKAGDVA